MLTTEQIKEKQKLEDIQNVCPYAMTEEKHEKLDELLKLEKEVQKQSSSFIVDWQMEK